MGGPKNNGTVQDFKGTKKYVSPKSQHSIGSLIHVLKTSCEICKSGTQQSVR